MPQQQLQRRLGVAAQRDLDGKSQTNSRRIAIDLHAATAVVPRIELEVREARANHQQRVGVFHRLLGRRGTEQADATGRERRIVWHHRLAEQRLDDRRREAISESLELRAGAERALARQDHRFPARVQYLHRRKQVGLARHDDVFAPHARRVALDFLRRRLVRAERLHLEIDGTRHVRDAPLRPGGATAGVDDGPHVAGAEHHLVVDRDVLEER